MDWRRVLEMAVPFFLIMDPMGNLPACLGLMHGLPPKRQKAILLRELVLALGVAVAFCLAGDALLGFLDIRQSTLRLAGGTILFVISMRMIYPEDVPYDAMRQIEPFIVPIAVPLVAGPSLLSAAMLYARQGPSLLPVLAALFLAWIGTAAIMLSGPAVSRLLGERGLRAMERLMGLVLILLAVQMLEDGVTLYLADHPPR